jgi:hypothetical protein
MMTGRIKSFRNAMARKMGVNDGKASDKLDPKILEDARAFAKKEFEEGTLEDYLTYKKTVHAVPNKTPKSVKRPAPDPNDTPRSTTSRSAYMGAFPDDDWTTGDIDGSTFDDLSMRNGEDMSKKHRLN